MAQKLIKLLLVEDNLGDAELIEEALERINLSSPNGALWHATLANRLAAGLHRLREQSIDLILLDLSLPDSQGLRTLTEITACAPSVPVVVLTSLDDEALALAAVQAGAQDYLVKGQIEDRLLSRALRYAIERKQLVNQLQAALAQVKLLSGLLPICASCKSIRDDRGYWQQIESYISAHSEAEFTHGICPECVRKLYPDYFKAKD